MDENEFEIVDISKANLGDIPENCRGCVYWEFPEELDKARAENTLTQRRLEFEKKKREWFIQTMNAFGTCGKIVYHQGKPVAYAQFAPSEQLPNVKAYESKLVGKLEENVVFLSCLYVVDEKMRRKGLGETLLTNIIEDLKKRGFKSVETFARRGNPENPSGPFEFYVRNGFIVKDNSNPEFPLVQLYL